MINEYENLLRTIICLVLGEGDDVEFGVSSERLSLWIKKREEENNKANQSLLESRIIYYSDFYDLQTIIHKNWVHFKPVLRDKKRFDVFHNEIEKLRNTIAHGRPLLTFQNDLLKGVLGYLKNLIVNFHNKNMDPDDYFIKILSISDNLGTKWEPKDSSIMKSDKLLRVGDEVEFYVDAFDPKGRDINIWVESGSKDEKKYEIDKPIIVTSEMIKKGWLFCITAKTEAAEYKNEDSVYIGYDIIP